MQLYAHQQSILDKFPHKHALVWQVGSGKTEAAIALAIKANQPTLIIVPKGLKTQWKERIDKYGLRAVILTKEEFRRDWHLISLYKTVIVDEFHYFLGISSKMSKALRSYVKKANPEYFWALTGTIYMSTPWNIYVACHIFGMPIAYITFKKRFFYEMRMGYRTIPVAREGIEDDLAAIVQRFGSTVRLEDCADVPEQIDVVEHFELTLSQKQAVNRVKLDESVPIAKFTKFHQICGGTLKGDEYVPDEYFVSYKTDRVQDLTTEYQRTIVVCRYNNEIGYLKKILKAEGKNVQVINGNTPGEERASILSSLANANEYVLLVNAACSEGWELPNCSTMIFYSYDFSLKNYIQMKARIQRINNLRKNTYISLIVKGTIDEDIYKTITEDKMDFYVAIYNQ